MNSFFSTSVRARPSVFSRSSGQGVSLAFAGMTPSRFWLAKIWSRSGVPAIVEQVHVADLLHPLRRRVVRRMRAARRVVDEEGQVRLDLVQLVQPVDGVVRHGGDQVPARLAVIGMDRRGVAEQIARLPLAGVAANEAIEVVEAHARSANGRRARPARLPGRRVVVLAEPGGAIAVLLQDAADGGAVLARMIEL